MNIVVSGPGGDRDLEVHAHDDATAADLATVIFPGGGGRLMIDGRPVDPALPLGESDLVSGSVLSLENEAPTRPHGPSAGAVELGILSGPGAGLSVELVPGRHVIGRGPGANVVVRAPGVAERHAVVDVDVSGRVIMSSLVADRRPMVVLPEATVRIGDCLIACAPVAPSAGRGRSIPGRRGTLAFNRPPRRIPTSRVPSLAVPAEPRPPGERHRMGVAAIVVPLLFGLTLAVVIHPRMALFALLGPVMMFAGWLDGKRRQRRFRRSTAEENAEAATRLGEQLDRLRAGEVRRRHRGRPSVTEMARRAVGVPTLWERRPSHPDFLRLVVGYARASWRPPLDGEPGEAAPVVRSALFSRATLPMAPVVVDLSPGRVLGVAGRRNEALQLARGLVCQAAVLHGPADVRVAVVTDRPGDWGWVKWLPHTLDDVASRRRLLAVTADELSRLASLLTPSPSFGPGGASATSPPGASDDPPPAATLLIVDRPDLAQPNLAPVRHLLSGRGRPVSGLVIVDDEDQLPSTCTSVAATTHRRHHLHVTGTVDGDLDVAVAGAIDGVAQRCALALARFDDPERDDDGAELPDGVDLLDLLDLASPTTEAIARRWAESSGRVVAPVGVTEAGPLLLDLVGDGPHGLLAGTTGSGKSELLRSLVSSLAVGVGPDRLNFVLIDYKGGSAFDACAGLPHTVGVVTDLDDRLAERALTCLEAELRYREERLRSAGVDDLASLLASAEAEPLPRMVIVIDEFAALAKELPQFMDALVDIGARGRSLGIHLLVATQRPAGVVRDNLRANTNLRIALRVQDRADSTDVLDDPRAAHIGRSQPGRGYLRLGPTEVIAFQSAIVTGSSAGESSARVRTRPFRFAMEPDPLLAQTRNDTAATDLDRLVAAASEAAALAGIPPPRRPWPDPLPERVTVAELDLSERSSRFAVPLGLVDEPERQRQRTIWWNPDDGSLLVYGSPGSGTTTVLTTVALGLAATGSATEVHLYVLDFDAGGVEPVVDLPHVGAVAGPGERERQVRLIRMLSAEVERRRARPATVADETRIVLLVDDYGAFSAAFEDPGDAPIKEAMNRLLAEGPGVGVVAVLTASRHNAIPPGVASTVADKMVFRLADPLAGAAFGLRQLPGDLPPGRGIQPDTGRQFQVALPGSDGLEAAVAAHHREPFGSGGPRAIEELPAVVKVQDIADAVRVFDEDWFVPIGIGDSSLEPVGLRLGEGDHVLIAGEPRSGKSTLLVAIATLMGSDSSMRIVAVAPRRSPLRDAPEIHRLVTDPSDLDAALLEATEEPGRCLVLIDDVDDLEGGDALSGLVASRDHNLHVIGAGRRDVKTRYQHWAKELCRSRRGVWLRPSPGLDGDLWSTPMPRRIPAGMPAGRGYLIADGAVELVQAATG